MKTPTTITDKCIEEQIAEFKRYENDTDWQEMAGDELVDVDPEKWLRTALAAALERGEKRAWDKMSFGTDDWKKLRQELIAEGAAAEREAILKALPEQVDEHKTHEVGDFIVGSYEEKTGYNAAIDEIRSIISTRTTTPPEEAAPGN